MAEMKIIGLFLVTLFLIVSLSQATNVRDCEKNAKYAVNVTGVEIKPNPVVSGKEAVFSISATTDVPITDGKLSIDVAYFGWYIHSETHDLCGETTCPVSTGDFVVSHSQVLPGFTPPGSYTLRMKMEDGNKNKLTCVTFDFKIEWGSSDSMADS